MASNVDIANNALSILGGSTISSLTEDSKNARVCSQRFENVRNRIFRAHPWNCLIKRVQLAQNTTAPVIEFTDNVFYFIGATPASINGPVSIIFNVFRPYS